MRELGRRRAAGHPSRPLIALFAFMFALMPAFAAAATSKGCADINTGQYNRTFSIPSASNGSQIQDQDITFGAYASTLSDFYFNNGDVVQFTLTSRVGTGYFSAFEYDDTGSIVRSVLNQTGNSATFTIGSNNLFRYYNYALSNFTYTAGGSANNDATAAHSNSSAFLTLTCTPASAGPTVTAVSPTSGPAAGGTAVTITGTGFTGATAVKFGATSATGITVVSATSITATAPAGSGTVDVTVTTPGGTSATSASDRFSYVAAPTVTAISPSSGPASGGTSVTITGTGFTGATAVKFGAASATGITVVSATSITATAPAGSGTVDVTVTTPGGTSA
ncbi:IPT/TIG domain-containing protein, partial [Sphingomonas sp. 3F27F9]